MQNTKQLTHEKIRAGDAAVDGLISGIVAGAVMALYLVIAGWLLGTDAGTMLARFDPGEATSPLRGALMHLAVSGVYGIVYALIATRLWRVRWPGALKGIAYAAILFVVTEGLLLPRTQSPLLAIPWTHFAIAHLLYGATLGVLNARKS